MSSLVEVMAEVASSCYCLLSCHWVEVTHVNNHNDFYVRPMALKKHLRMLEACDGPVEESKLIPGSVVVYKSEIRQRYVRGRIKNVRVQGDVKICDMFSLDYGFFESVFADSLKMPKREGMPALSVCCKLEQCTHSGIEFDNIATESKLFDKGNSGAKMIVKGHTADKLVVKLIKLGQGNTYAIGQTHLDQPKLFFTYKKVQVGDSIHVRVQSGGTLRNFYVADISDYRNYIAELTDLFTYLRVEAVMRPEDMKIGKPVAVHNGFKYERAVIKKIIVPGEKAIVQLVDLGRIIEIDMLRSGMKALERERYFARPALAIYVSTEDNQAWDTGKPRFLYPGHEFVITVLKVGKDHETPNIVNLTRINM